MSSKHSGSAPFPRGGNKLVVLSAPSGGGKSTLARMLLENHPNAFALSISHTTRAPRGEEKNGIHYYFVDEPEFHRMAQAGEFVEFAHVFGRHWYGSSKAWVERTLASGKNALFDVDVQGADALKKIYGTRCVTIFVLPPSFKELEERLRKRKTENTEAIDMRLKTAQEELKASASFDQRIVNVDLAAAFSELERVLREEQCL